MNFSQIEKNGSATHKWLEIACEFRREEGVELIKNLILAARPLQEGTSVKILHPELRSVHRVRHCLRPESYQKVA
jgi:hypothetical protein